MSARHFDGDDLRRLRREAGLLQADVAARIGGTPKQVTTWEAKQRVPDPERLPAIAAALGLDLDEAFPRDGDPDLADLRCDAGITQRDTAQIIGAKSHIPVFKAEQGRARLQSAYVPLLARAYGVTEEALCAAQDRSFGLEPARSDGPSTLAEKIAFLSEQRFPAGRAPSDADLAAAVNAAAGEAVMGPEIMAALRADSAPLEDLLVGVPTDALHEGLGEVFGISPMYFRAKDELERRVAEAINVIAALGNSDVALAARGAENHGLGAEMVRKLSALLSARPPKTNQ